MWPINLDRMYGCCRHFLNSIHSPLELLVIEDAPTGSHRAPLVLFSRPCAYYSRWEIAKFCTFTAGYSAGLSSPPFLILTVPSQTGHTVLYFFSLFSSAELISYWPVITFLDSQLVAKRLFPVFGTRLIAHQFNLVRIFCLCESLNILHFKHPRLTR